LFRRFVPKKHGIFPGKLVGKLQLSHEGISTQVIDKCVSAVETKIRQAEQLASQPENASFTVKFPSKYDGVCSVTAAVA